jgi:c-di-GMP-binding flagellar brake protein YcgR
LVDEDAMNNSGFSIPRTAQRIRVRLPVRLRFGWKHSEETKASTVDISEQGMSVRCRAALRLGMEVEAILDSAREDLKVYRVVWSREAESSDHGFSVGLELKP